jgi:polyisoprenoid-binding protein YceI
MSIQSAAIRAMTLVVVSLAVGWPVAAASGPAPGASAVVLEFDPARTTVAFTLSGWPHDTHGTFKLKRGLVAVYPETGRMDGSITVDASSGKSGERLRDARMTGSILEAARFPDISFAPRQVENHGDPQGEFPVKISGLLMLHGAVHDFTVDARVSRGVHDATIRCSFVIPYVEWGLEDPSILMFTVAKEVRIDLTTYARWSWRDR